MRNSTLNFRQNEIKHTIKYYTLTQEEFTQNKNNALQAHKLILSLKDEVTEDYTKHVMQTERLYDAKKYNDMVIANKILHSAALYILGSNFLNV